MLQQFLHDFGYFALFIGTFFEGETILVLAGFLAFRGYMDINLVVVVAFCGSYAGDQLWYFMGRKHGRKLLARKPRWQMMGDRALEHIRKHPDIWVLSFRFVYGLRTVMPVAIGLSGYPPGRYLLLNGIGAAIWATALAAAAYHFGAVLEGMLGSIKKYELWVLGALLVITCPAMRPATALVPDGPQNLSDAFAVAAQPGCRASAASSFRCHGTATPATAGVMTLWLRPVLPVWWLCPLAVTASAAAITIAPAPAAGSHRAMKPSRWMRSPAAARSVG